MAEKALGGGAFPFKIPVGLDAIKARDAEFWRAHAAWRLAIDDFEIHPGYPDKCPQSAALLNRSDALFEAMMCIAVRTAGALFMKYDALREGGCGLDRQIHPAYTAGDVLAWDLERLLKFEMFGSDAFQDMSEG